MRFEMTGAWWKHAPVDMIVSLLQRRHLVLYDVLVTVMVDKRP